MSTMHDAGRGSGAQHGVLGPPDTPAQAFAAISGAFLTALGALTLFARDVGFGALEAGAGRAELLLWTASGWTSVLWIAMGVLGLLSMAQLDTATAYSLLAGVVFAVVAVWGFVNGSEVAGVIVADMPNNVTHAILAGVGLAVGMLPREAQGPQEPVTRTDPPVARRRLDAEQPPRSFDRRAAGRR